LLQATGTEDVYETQKRRLLTDPEYFTEDS